MSNLKLNTPVCTLAYPKLATPDAMNEGDTKQYSVELIFDTDEDLSALTTATRDAAQEKWGSKIPKVLKRPIRDGDACRESEAYAGRKFMAARSKSKPKCYIKDASGKIVLVDTLVPAGLDPAEREAAVKAKVEEIFYPGCKVVVNVTAAAFDTGSNGLKFYLNAVMFVADGERLGGSGGSSADDFANVDAEVCSAASGEEDVPF